ncbi:DUF2262 domain-containing protein [Nostoc sp. PCC 7107]|uniref:DUF2262 domain-containing protein n=1 Tax=Nostoc sp. PCC 7107 TaxID=317936 RepID=UPI0005CA64F2|nr:DUF2262 domain-containing protein [Nostoc sp. PCC 7107]
MFNLIDYTFNKGLQWYEASFMLDGVKINITVSAEGEKKNSILESRIKKSIDWITKNKEEILDFCSQELLEDKNSEEWLKEGESELTPSEFKRNLTMKAIHINEDGSVTIDYGDNKMFWGHTVVVAVTDDFSLDYATIEG